MIREALGHHAWATGRLLEVCANLSEEQLNQPIPATYGSILDTLRHLVDADNWYLQGLSGGELGRDEVDERSLSLGDVRDLARANADAWNALLSMGIGDDPDVDIVTERHDGSVRHATAGIRSAQAIHHGTDHRSQVCTALSVLGTEPPEIDVWAYGEAVGTVRTTR
jgi:uncharacterized damage-inducible protein DinB